MADNGQRIEPARYPTVYGADALRKGAHLVITGAAEHGPIARRLETQHCLAAAGVADRCVALRPVIDRDNRGRGRRRWLPSLRRIPALYRLSRFGGGIAALDLAGLATAAAALGLICETLGGMELLVARREGERLMAVHTGQGFVLKGHALASWFLRRSVRPPSKQRRGNPGRSRPAAGRAPQGDVAEGRPPRVERLSRGLLIRIGSGGAESAADPVLRVAYHSPVLEGTRGDATGPASPRSGGIGPVSLRRLRGELIALLRGRGRDDLALEALGEVTYTDDGSTLYVHILPNPAWPHRRAGQAYALAYADYAQVATLEQHREFLREAWLLLHDEIDDIIRWFDGR